MPRDLPNASFSVLLGLGLSISACTTSGDPAALPGDAQVARDAAVPGDELDADARREPDGGTSLDAGQDTMRDAELDAMREAAMPTEDAGFAPFEGGTMACAVQAPTECPDAGPRYGDVAPIFRERCVVCHAPTWTGPWPLDEYEHVADWKDDIRSHLLDCTMPPPEAGVPMTNEERLEILTWLRCGLPM